MWTASTDQYMLTTSGQGTCHEKASVVNAFHVELHNLFCLVQESPGSGSHAEALAHLQLVPCHIPGSSACFCGVDAKVVVAGDETIAALGLGLQGGRLSKITGHASWWMKGRTRGWGWQEKTELV